MSLILQLKFISNPKCINKALNWKKYLDFSIYTLTTSCNGLPLPVAFGTLSLCVKESSIFDFYKKIGFLTCLTPVHMRLAPSPLLMSTFRRHEMHITPLK